MTPNSSPEPRDLRQQGIHPTAQMEQQVATVIGCGAIGRQAALYLTALGVGTIHLYDPDRVEEVNLSTQGWEIGDLGDLKAQVVAETCGCMNDRMKVVDHAEAFTADNSTGGSVFCCVDSMAARKRIVGAAERSGSPFLVDGRMSASAGRVLTCHDAASWRHWRETWFPDADALDEPCTQRGMWFTAGIAAGLMVNQYSKWLRGLPLENDFQMDLLGTDLIVTRSASQADDPPAPAPPASPEGPGEAASEAPG